MWSRRTKDQTGQSSGLSRRSFLRGTGLLAAGGTLLDTALLGVPAKAEELLPPVLGPGAVPLTLNVNGRDNRLQVEPRTTLAEALRGPLNLSGTKIACNRGACSACTVWIDGAPVASCMILTIEVGTRAVTTIEGLARGETLHPVQEAFIDHDAMQCGFCTPGLVMSAAALIERNPQPTLADVKGALSGHLCRCGSYPKVFAATLAAAKQRG